MRRAVPTQARSAATVEKILAAAVAILSEKGLAGVNTNAVAQRAGVNVATLYHYFPDKVAILAELFRRDQEIRVQFLAKRLAEFPNVLEPLEWTRELVASLIHLRRANPTMVVLRRASRSVPELLALEDAANDRLVEGFARVVRQRYRRLSPARARAIARTLIETGAPLIDRLSWEGDEAPALMRETVLLIACYVEHLERGG